MKKSSIVVYRSNTYRQKQAPSKMAVASGIGVAALVIGATMLGASNDWYGKLMTWRPLIGQNSINSANQENSKVLHLVSLPTSERAASLEAIAQGKNSLEQSRARYLLATDLLQQKQATKALSWLEGLDKNYPVLAPYVLLKRSQAYELSGDKAKYQEVLRELVKSYPDSPVAAEAMYVLGSRERQFWDQAIAKFPSHPRTLEIIRQQLTQNPNQQKLMLLLVKYAPDSPNITSVLDQLSKQYAAQLKPEDWELIASSYWQNQEYSKAASAYMGATETPFNAYRVARSLELSGQKPAAINAYQYVVSHFPNAQETAGSLIRLANLSDLPEALSDLDQVQAKFPERASQALSAKAEMLVASKNTQAAQQNLQLLLTKYGNSEAAAEYRWKEARSRAAAGDLQAALQLAQTITVENPNSLYAARATFWSGKWARILGNEKQAKKMFEKALAQYPQSYYAWRSAVHLGWDVGDFTTVRQLSPDIVRPTARSQPPAGSKTFKELYQLGQDRDAWILWQTELQNRLQPTVAEQFTDGLLKLKLGKHQQGIALISKLEDRETPAEQAEYQAIRERMTYWRSLYPFPYMEFIEKWSQQRQINPLLVTALIRQESRFEPAIKSPVGATGLMQLIPTTAAAEAKTENLQQYSLTNPRDNIQLGTAYLDTTHQHYNNNSLLAVASYNAGPGNVSKWLKEKPLTDPDEFVEAIPFEETEGYVKNVFGNYWNYLRLYNPEVSQQLAQHSASQSTAMR
ncbi:MAG TPA: transglycosylase SLT domain-containing protein [Oculatellaceae cyanobacterium]|jgi:soluble lytic murein transglycosylase